MNKKEKLLLFESLLDIKLALKNKIPIRWGSIGDLENKIKELKEK